MGAGITENDIEKRVTGFYESPNLIQYPYHNLAHTQAVVRHSKEIAGYYHLNRADHFILTAAAWFHDIGHLYGEMQGHEERGVLIMEYYLQSAQEHIVTAIRECIMATRSGTQPKHLREQIICDADTYHFGTPLFQHTDLLVEKEMEIRTGKKNLHWHEDSLKFLEQHTFYTGYCQDLLTEGKQQNIAWLRQLIQNGS